MLGFTGSIAMSPTARDGWWSVSGVQVGVAASAFVVFQTPPCAPPTYTVLGSVGWTAMADTRPLTGETVGPAPVSVCPLGIDEGPSGPQTAVSTRFGAGSPIAPRSPPLFATADWRALASALGGIVSAG